MFFWSSLAFSMIQWMLAIWSVVPLSFRNPASTSGWMLKFTVHVLLKPDLENFEHYFASVWDEWNYIPAWMESDLLTWQNHSEHLQKLKLLTGVCVCVCVCVCVHTTPWTVAHQAPLSMGFSRQEYWSGLPLPPPRDFPNPGIGPVSPTSTGSFFITEPLGNTYRPLTLKFLLILGYISYRYLTA